MGENLTGYQLLTLTAFYYFTINFLCVVTFAFLLLPAVCGNIFGLESRRPVADEIEGAGGRGLRGPHQGPGGQVAGEAARGEEAEGPVEGHRQDTDVRLEHQGDREEDNGEQAGQAARQ